MRLCNCLLKRLVTFIANKEHMAAAAKMYNNKPPKQMEKKSSNAVRIRASHDENFWKYLPNLSKSPRCNFGKNHMAATHTSKRKQCTNNRRHLKLKTYEILCGYVRSVTLEHLKCCFSFVCDAEGIRAEETTNVHVQVNKVWTNQCRNYSARCRWQLLHKCKTTNHRSKL